MNAPQPLLDRAIPLTCRADLQSVVINSPAGLRYRIKDPISRHFFELNEHEFALLSLLDGRRSLRVLASEFRYRFPTLRLEFLHLQTFLARLRQSGLVIPLARSFPSIDTAPALWLKWLSSAQLFLAWRLPGINPGPLLSFLEPLNRIIFAPLTAVLFVASLLLSSLLVAGDFHQVVNRLPAIHEWLSVQAAGLVVSALLVTRVLHELGHAICCRYFGGHVSELGVFLFCGAPCLYCDVSDAWMLTSRWKRIAISFAGIVVELAIASVATLVWWMTPPGMVHALSLVLVMTCGVNTLLINGNPLLRYDGYYILIDLLEEPHLSENASQLWYQWLGKLLWNGEVQPVSKSKGRMAFYAFYGAASAGYRGLVLMGVLWFVYTIGSRWGGVAFGQLGAIVLASSIGVTMAVRIQSEWQLAKQNPSRVSTRWRWISLALVMLAFVFFIPFPQRVPALVEIEASQATRIYARTAGELQFSVTANANVQSGDVIAELVNPDLKRSLVQLQGELSQAQLQLKRLEIARGQDPSAAAGIPAARETVASLARRLEQRKHDLQQLSIRSETAGIVYPPPRQLRESTSALRKDAWNTDPLDKMTTGCWIETGTLICVVGSEEMLQPTLFVEQESIDLVAVGQEVRVQLAANPANVVTGVITEVATQPIDTSSSSTPSGQPHSPVQSPLVTPFDSPPKLFACRVQLDGDSSPRLLRDTGQARIHVKSATIASRIGRLLKSLIPFRW